jgi:uncharacterized protein (TIGR02145 family)/uncharacterized repeat protein (TIGR02543 family)
VTFNSQDGSAVTSQTVNYDAKASAPTDPTRTGYTFGGWFKEAGCTNEWVFGTDIVTGATTIYAKWTLNIYTITFSVNGGGTVSPTTAQTGEGWKLTLTSLPTPTRNGYIFKGWFTASTGGTAVTINDVYSDDATIYAQWVEQRTITFNANGGTVSPTFGLTGIDSMLTIPLPEPARDGYIFMGWFTTINNWPVTENRKYYMNETIYAKWKTEIIKIPFIDSRDGKTYQKVTIGTQTWMAENLNYDGKNSDGTGNEIGRCYGDDDANCDTYGRLYDWTTAMNGASSSSLSPSGVRGACPVDWHLPSQDEWGTLISYVGNTSTAGTPLKSEYWSGINNIPAGTDDYGFTALPGGIYEDINNGFFGVETMSRWWTTNEGDPQYDGPDAAYYRRMTSTDTRVSDNWSSKNDVLVSVRCVED